MFEVTPIMLTLAIILGCVLLGLILQVLNHVQIRNLENRILSKQDKIQKSIPQPMSLEDMIQRDLQEQMTYDPIMDLPTQKEMEDMVDQMNRG